MKIDIPMPPGQNATKEQLDAYLRTLREYILMLAAKISTEAEEE